MSVDPKKLDLQSITIVPLKGSVIFPGFATSLFIGRQKSIATILDATKNNSHVLFVLQKDASIDIVGTDDVYSVGTVCSIDSFLRLSDGSLKVLLNGQYRAKLHHIEEINGCDVAYIEKIDYKVNEYANDIAALMMAAFSTFESFMATGKQLSQDALNAIKLQDDPSKFADSLAIHLPLREDEKQNILEIIDVSHRIERLMYIMMQKVELANMEKKIQSRVKKQIDRNQKEYYLNEQLKAIHKELGQQDDIHQVVQSFKKKIKNSGMHDDVMSKVNSELKKLMSAPSMSHETTIIRNYLDWIVSLPWKIDGSGATEYNIADAKNKLDASHYGLLKVKDRVLEYIAVLKRKGKISGQVMCFVGPPGVGKTSLGKAIANAMNREFVRISLGGVSDEAEIRGHRRTYISAMPGKIIQAMKKVKTMNPVIMLDEIDKISSAWKGDPSSALLEVLDPEQNNAFVDNYIELPYDLSQVVFIATANSLDIPYPLLDRMEVISISGYTQNEKISIAESYIIPKQKDKNGLDDNELMFDHDSLCEIIKSYTMESGVRGLERQIAKISRKVVLENMIAADRSQSKSKAKKTSKTITVNDLTKYLGAKKYKHTIANESAKIGVSTGLAWTESGGEILFIESLLLNGDGTIITTGKLGEVMQESIKAAYSYVKANMKKLNLVEEAFKKDIHIHVPEGATPKDGPSAGIAICTSIVSVLAQKSVQPTIAMTGEITLVGNVLAIGGLREKLLAAVRSGIKTVLIPSENEKDLSDIPQEVLDTLDIKCVSHIDEVLSNVFGYNF